MLANIGVKPGVGEEKGLLLEDLQSNRPPQPEASALQQNSETAEPGVFAFCRTPGFCLCLKREKTIISRPKQWEDNSRPKTLYLSK